MEWVGDAGQIILLSCTTTVIHFRHRRNIMRWQADSESNRIHMAVEGSVGGTTVGLHMAADTISNGGRVLWVGLSMPNPERFPQLFSRLSLVDSSRFHALLIAGSLDKAIQSIISAASSLPSVELIVLDDWCENSGKIPKKQLQLVTKLAESVSEKIRLVLISKGSIDASGERSGSIFARAENYFTQAGFEIWTFSRSANNHTRILSMGERSVGLRIVDDGLEHMS